MNEEHGKVDENPEVAPVEPVKEAPEVGDSAPIPEASKNPLMDAKAEVSQEGNKDIKAQTAPVFELEKLNVPEGFTINEEIGQSLKEVATREGLSSQQVNSLIDLHAKTVRESQMSYIKTCHNQVRAIPVEERQLALQGVERYLPDDLKSKILGDDAVLTPDIVRILAILGKVGGEGTFIEGKEKHEKGMDLSKMFPSMQ